jgi:hypothetical protein
VIVAGKTHGRYHRGPRRGTFVRLAMRLFMTISSSLALLSSFPSCRGAGSPTSLEGRDCHLKEEPEPAIIALEAPKRAEIDKLRKRNVLAARYETKGCEVSIELLPQCVGPANRYVYTPMSGTDTFVVHDVDELVAKLPVGATTLVGAVRERGALRVDTKLVGAYALPEGSKIGEIDFVGPECKRATHFVRAVYVGGFAVSSNAKGAEAVAREGTPVICDRAAAEGLELSGCAAPLRLALVPMASGRAEVPLTSHAMTKQAEAPVSGTLDQNAIERVTRSHQTAVRRACWESGSEAVKRITITVVARVDTNGAVVRAEPKITDLDGPSDVASAVARCVANQVRTWRFPEPDAEKSLTLPFHLLRQ